MLYVAQAYPAIAEELHALLAERTLTQGNLAMVKDFIFLFEFAIPAVNIFSFRTFAILLLYNVAQFLCLTPLRLLPNLDMSTKRLICATLHSFF